MNIREQNIAIAKACGWVRRPDLDWMVGDYVKYAYSRNGYIVEENELQDYVNDLNAIHLAENLCLDKKTAEIYTKILKELSDLNGWYYHRASAKCRAEALLKTLNLWEE